MILKDRGARMVAKRYLVWLLVVLRWCGWRQERLTSLVESPCLQIGIRRGTADETTRFLIVEEGNPAAAATVELKARRQSLRLLLACAKRQIGEKGCIWVAIVWRRCGEGVEGYECTEVRV